MSAQRPKCVVMVAFAHGSITVQTAASKDEVIKIMKGNDKGEIVLHSISQTEVKTDPRASEVVYVLANEQIHFHKTSVVFFSISEAIDPPVIDRTMGGIINLEGRRMNP